LTKDAEEIISSELENDLDRINVLSHIDMRISQFSMTAILFGIMTVESFINQYASRKLSSSFFKKYLDNLDLKSKWIIIPKLINGNIIDTHKQAFQHLKELIKRINILVHDKLKITKLRDWKNRPFGIEDSIQAKNTVVELINELHDVDSSINISWLSYCDILAKISA